jgi:hypothetical protein
LKGFWGRHPRRDPMEGFFIHWIASLASHKIIDMEPPKVTQTWRNGCKGDDLVTKRLDRFLIAKKMMENPWIMKSSVLVGVSQIICPYFSTSQKRV